MRHLATRISHGDVLEQLQSIMDRQPGTADSDVNVLAIEYGVPYLLLIRLKEEIVRLRKEAGDGSRRDL